MERNSKEPMLSKVAEHIPSYFERKKTNETRCSNLFPFQRVQTLYNCFDFFIRNKSIQFNNITDYETDTYFYSAIFYFKTSQIISSTKIDLRLKRSCVKKEIYS